MEGDTIPHFELLPFKLAASMSALSSEPALAAESASGLLRYPASGGFDDAGSNRIGRCQSYVKRNRDAGDWPA